MEALRLGQSGSAWGALLLAGSVILRNCVRGVVYDVIIPRAYSTVHRRAKWAVLLDWSGWQLRAANTVQ